MYVIIEIYSYTSLGLKITKIYSSTVQLVILAEAMH